jgi:DNA-binding NarL/FixJ family response regulator
MHQGSVGSDPSGAVRVMVVDHHGATRNGLGQVLRHAAVEVVGEAATGEEALNAVRELRPDVVVVASTMPGIDGVEATRRIRATEAEPGVLLLTSDTQEEQLLPILAAGGSGFVRKAGCHSDLGEAVRAAARGDAFLYPEAVSFFLRAYRDLEAAGEIPPAALGDPERALFRLAAAGYSSRSIGRQLGIPIRAVDAARRELRRQLRLENLADVAAFAARAGLFATLPNGDGKERRGRWT